MQAEELRHGLDVLRDMQKRGYQPNIITWCHLISSLSKTRRKGRLHHEAAYSLWQELRQELRASDSLAADMDASSYATGMHLRFSVGFQAKIFETRSSVLVSFLYRT